MFLRWPIKKKLIVCLLLIFGSMSVLTLSGGHGLYSYRALVKGISQRAAELPIAMKLFQRVSDLRLTQQRMADCLRRDKFHAEDQRSSLEMRIHNLRFQEELSAVRGTLDEYREQVANATISALTYTEIGDVRNERATFVKIERVLTLIDRLRTDDPWSGDPDLMDALGEHLDELSQLAAILPTFLQERMHTFADDVRLKYRMLIILTWLASSVAIGLLFLLGRLFYTWVLCPLRQLIHGSREVARGDFTHRIRLESQDEMAELAQAMNHMTSRFQEIRDDLDCQVRERTREVVRSEQLASVGFLAAGVAHEINNPLSTIALCAESLEDRLDEIIQKDDTLPDDEHNQEITQLRHYLRMMQDEAFRCKEITERLLDFSRLGDVEKHLSDLRELAQDVISMLMHLGKYKQKSVHLDAPHAVYAQVNPREFKQVLLNLITNGFDSVEQGGWVRVQLQARDGWARLVVTDNGCGMTEEVKRHLFEPFFTRRRDGQGTGLGMSISYRIVQDHGGTITADSAGSGKGATITVTLPLAEAPSQEEPNHYQQAA